MEINIDDLISLRDGEQLNIDNYTKKCQRRIDKLNELIGEARKLGFKSKSEIEAERISKEVKRKDPPTEADGSMD